MFSNGSGQIAIEVNVFRWLRPGECVNKGFQVAGALWQFKLTFSGGSVSDGRGQRRGGARREMRVQSPVILTAY